MSHVAFHPKGFWARPRRYSYRGRTERLWWIVSHPEKAWTYVAFPDLDYDDTRYRISRLVFWMLFVRAKISRRQQ
jgi:hypothetical protein